MDLIVVRLLFVALLAGSAIFSSSVRHDRMGERERGRRAACAVIVFEFRVRAPQPEALIGARAGSVLGIMGAALFAWCCAVPR